MLPPFATKKREEQITGWLLGSSKSRYLDPPFGYQISAPWSVFGGKGTNFTPLEDSGKHTVPQTWTALFGASLKKKGDFGEKQMINRSKSCHEALRHTKNP